MRDELMPERPGASSPAPASDAAFGARLRMERERRRITLASIAANTKISLHLLEGLERGQVTRWPSGIFRRSFIRAYAEAIGLDSDEIAREFLLRFPDAADLPFEAPGPEGRRMSGNEPVLRLNLADLESTSSRGTLLLNMGPRWAAAAWDVCVLMAIGLLFFAAFNRFWMPLAIATLLYYAVGILVLGNTPGVSLFAPTPGERARPPVQVRASIFKVCAAVFRQASGRRGEAVNR
jgi:transcriptional regulator with XRE-family HTH domain